MRIFLSAVSAEFRAYRDQLRSDLTRHNVEVKVQEDFKDLGGSTLDKLDVYIANCDLVIHLVGDMPGAYPIESDQAALLAKYLDLTTKFPPLGEAIRAGRVSYTQWEAWLALYHRKHLQIAKATATAPRENDKYKPTAEGKAAQAAHLGWLRAVERYPGCEFASPDQLSSKIAYSGVLDELATIHHQPKPHRPQNLPFASLGALFKGREGFLTQLHEALCQTAPGHATAVIGKAVHGVGGIGKTRLAVEYAYRHEVEHSATLFVRADTPELLNASLAMLAGPEILDLQEKDNTDDAVKIRAALGWLENHPGWLMMLDNVDDEKAATATQKLLAKLRGGRVLITGRMSNFSAAVKKLELGVLTPSDGASFLLERTDGYRRKTPEDPALALLLTTELGGLALGLEQAAAYIATERITFGRYHELWRDKRAIVLNWFDKDLMSYDHDTGLAATWATSVERLTPDGRRLLERLAFFSPEPIPDSLLDVSDRLNKKGLNARSSISGLYAYSLASHSKVETGRASTNGFVVHRLVQDFTRRTIESGRIADTLREALNWFAGGFQGHPLNVDAWTILDPLAPHASTLANRGADAEILEIPGWILGKIGTLFDAKAIYDQAECAKRRSLALGERAFGSNHPEVALRLHSLGELLRATHRLDEAEILYRRALAIDEASYGASDPRVGKGLSNLAELLTETTRYREAEPMFRRAIEIEEASAELDHEALGIKLSNFAGLLELTNRFDEAEVMHRRALAVEQAGLGSANPSVAQKLNNLAAFLLKTNRSAEAEEMFRRALAINELVYGPDHPRVALVLNNLAELLRHTNRFYEVEEMLRRALAINQSAFGAGHPSVATSLGNLAGLLTATKRYSEAEPLVRCALEIMEASYGPDHPHVATALNNLAELLRTTNRLSEAEPLYQRALAIDKASETPDLPNVAARLNNFGLCLQATNRLDQSVSMFRQSLSILETCHGPNHPNVAMALSNLALSLKHAGRHGEAKPMYKRALAILEASFGRGHPATETVRHNLVSLPA